MLVEKYLGKYQLITEKKRLTLKKLLDIPKEKKVSDYYENDMKGGKQLALDIISKIKSGELRRLQNEIEIQKKEEEKQKLEQPAVEPTVDTSKAETETPAPEIAEPEPEKEIEDTTKAVEEPNKEESNEKEEIKEDIILDEEESDKSPEEEAKAYIARVMNLPWAGEDNVFQKAYIYLTKIRQKV